MPRHAPELECSAEDKASLVAITKSRIEEARVVERARIILACLGGKEIQQVAREYQVEILPELTMQLEDEIGTPEVGYPVMKKFLSTKPDFTAVFAYNDISAIGAIRALADVGISVPQKVSVMGFDDIDAAAFQTPSLTTVRQPLMEMGRMAARTLLDRLSKGGQEYPKLIAVEPALIVRESTAPRHV